MRTLTLLSINIRSRLNSFIQRRSKLSKESVLNVLVNRNWLLIDTRRVLLTAILGIAISESSEYRTNPLFLSILPKVHGSG